MNGVILWLPGETVLTPSLAPKAEKSILKKRPFQATLSQDLKASLPPEPGVRADDAGSLLKVNNRLTDLDMKVVEISSPQAWEEALQDITQAGICGLDLETTGLDPLSSRARLAQLSLPSGRVYVADLWELGRERASPCLLYTSPSPRDS